MHQRLQFLQGGGDQGFILGLGQQADLWFGAGVAQQDAAALPEPGAQPGQASLQVRQRVQRQLLLDREVFKDLRKRLKTARQFGAGGSWR